LIVLPVPVPYVLKASWLQPLALPATAVYAGSAASALN
jgi:hypothetical protein